MKRTVLITDLVKKPAVEGKVLGRGVDIVTAMAVDTDSIDGRIWRSADAILVSRVNVGRAAIERLGRCRIIVKYGVGYDKVDMTAATERGIAVCNVPDYGTEEVADHTMAIFLSLSRRILTYTDATRDAISEWSWRRGTGIKRLRGMRFGIVGCGRIGTAVAVRAKAFGMDVMFYDPYLPWGYEKSIGVRRVHSILDIARLCDVITFHTPLTAETRKMANGAFFRACARKPILINTSRGDVIDTNELIRAIENKMVSQAGLDVLETEPPRAESRLAGLWSGGDASIRAKLLITPHCAFYSASAINDMRRGAAEEVRREFSGEKLKNCVNREYINFR